MVFGDKFGDIRKTQKWFYMVFSKEFSKNKLLKEEIKESEGEVLLRFEFPGVKKKDIDFKIDEVNEIFGKGILEIKLSKTFPKLRAKKIEII